LEEIRREIQVMSLFGHHANVVSYYTSFVHEHSLWLVMEYLAGGCCADIMKFGFPRGLDEAAIKLILNCTLKAMIYFHGWGRIHRDIKAANILVGSDGGVMLGDFGVSTSILDQQSSHMLVQPRSTFCGTPCWMAPEILLCQWCRFDDKICDVHASGYDFGIDIWAFGITAVELARGRPPLYEYPPSKVFSMILQNSSPTLEDDDKNTPREFRRKYSNNFKDMVRMCLQKDPKQRPTASSLLNHKFFRHKKKQEYLVSALLSHQPSLEERFRILYCDSYGKHANDSCLADPPNRKLK